VKKVKLKDGGITLNLFSGDGFDGASYWYFSREPGERQMRVTLSRRDAKVAAAALRGWAEKELKEEFNCGAMFGKFEQAVITLRGEGENVMTTAYCAGKLSTAKGLTRGNQTR
jgi:hypothetical protein